MRIAVIMMQRDESDLLHPWITYHSALLGPENLVIIDNGSIESAALARLDQARSEGVRVISAPTRADFKRKGPLVQNIGRALSETHDWIVPLDCDEFLGTFDKDRFVAGRDELERAFRSAARKGAVARVTHAFWNLPGQTGLYYNKIHKVAFKPQAPIKLDKGFHLFDGKSKSSLVPEGLETASRICYLHYHNRHAAELLKSARYKLEGQVPDFRRRTLIDFKGSGRHVARYFMSEPETYHRKLKPATWDAAAVFEDVGLVPPFSDAAAPLSEEELRRLRDPVNLSRFEEETCLSRSELRLLYHHLFNAERYFETGSTGTARLACEAGVGKIVAVDTDVDRCHEQISQGALLKYIHCNRLEVRHVDIGETCELGYPVNPPARHRVERLVDQPRDIGFDLALISGRFRVATAAAAYFGAREGGLVAIRDFAGRPEYHALREIFQPVAEVEKLTLFERRPGDRSMTALRLRDEHLSDPR